MLSLSARGSDQSDAAQFSEKSPPHDEHRLRKTDDSEPRLQLRSSGGTESAVASG